KRKSFQSSLPPSQSRRYMFQYRREDVYVIIHTEGIGNGEQNGVGFPDGFVFGQLLYQLIGLGGIASAKYSPTVGFQYPNLIGSFCLVAKIVAILIVYQCKNRTTYRHPGFTGM